MTEPSPPNTPTRPSVSVVVPCYNVEGYVREAITSALAQHHRPLEVIAVDDGSTDRTLDVLREVEREHPDLVRVIAVANGGAPAARNHGLREARGEYVQFLDADDVLDADKVEAQLAVAQAEEADLVIGGFRRIDHVGEKRNEGTAGESHWANLAFGRLGITSANLWKRSAVERVGGWDESWPSSQEAELMFRLLKAGAHVAYDAEARTALHTRTESISNRGYVPRTVRWIRLRADILAQPEAREDLSDGEVEAVRGMVFQALRGLYAADRSAAVALHREVIPTGYVPAARSLRERIYGWGYRLLGFGRTEGLLAGLRRDHG